MSDTDGSEILRKKKASIDAGFFEMISRIIGLKP
jgi:hypothetical protein